MRSRLLLLGAAAIAFGASLGSCFHFDDYAIFSNPAVESGRGWLEIWTLRETRPLTWLTFWMNRQLGAGDPLGYHLFNLIFHLAAVWLAFECFRRLLPERAALIAGILFAIHPLQSEAVNYIWARSIMLAAVGCFAALWQWMEGRPWRALACFALALLAKEECAAFPLFLAWLEWRGALPGTEKRHVRTALAAMFGIALAAGARVIWAAAVVPGAAAGAQAGIRPLAYLAAQGAVIVRYFQLFLVPYGFTADADMAVARWIGVAGWCALAAATWWCLRRRPEFATWWIAGLILLLPSSSLFPAADLSADRRMYLALFAFAAAAAVELARIRQAAVLAAIFLTLGVVSVERTFVWMTEKSLWTEAAERAPHKLRPKLQLSRALPAAQGLELLSKARDEWPHDPDLATETGKILLSEGQFAGALEEFGRALALSPMDARCRNNRGVALMALGQIEAARADFERAIQADPALNEARQNLAKLPPPIQ
jgi:protein O-mannosyl-transferase